MEIERLFPWHVTGEGAGVGQELAALTVVLHHAFYLAIYSFAIAAGVLIALKVF